MGNRRSIAMLRWSTGRVLLGLGAAMVWPDAADATLLQVAAFKSPAMTPLCTLHPGSGDEIETGDGINCTSTAFDPVLADWHTPFYTGTFDGTPPTTQNFDTTFGNWNKAQGVAAGGSWKLINGGDLDVTFRVTDIASANPTLGGIGTFRISVTLDTGYVGPSLDQLVWTQAVYDSYSFRPPFQTDLNPPQNTLDTFSTSQGNPQGTDVNGDTTNAPFLNPCQPIPGQTPGPGNTTPATIGASSTVPVRGYCDPLYPFQSANKSFFDAPQAFWPDESFRAVALLSTITFKTDATGNVTERDLTVYDGVDWGFDLSVPEPSTMLSLVASLVALGLFRGVARRPRS